MTSSSVPIMPAALAPSDAAAYISRDVKTLANWRSLGIGPSYVKTDSRGVLYRRADLDAWLEANVVVTKGSK